MKCPICGGAELKHETRDVEHEYKGRKTVLHGITGSFCDACGEVIFTPEESNAFSVAAAAFNREVNAEETDPALIAAGRKRMKLTQQEAAEIFGGGVNAFSRYETGRIAPPRALVALFEFFDAYPEQIEKFKALQQRKEHHA